MNAFSSDISPRCLRKGAIRGETTTHTVEIESEKEMNKFHIPRGSFGGWKVWEGLKLKSNFRGGKIIFWTFWSILFHSNSSRNLIQIWKLYHVFLLFLVDAHMKYQIKVEQIFLLSCKTFLITRKYFPLHAQQFISINNILLLSQDIFLVLNYSLNELMPKRSNLCLFLICLICNRELAPVKWDFPLA